MDFSETLTDHVEPFLVGERFSQVVIYSGSMYGKIAEANDR